MVIWSLLHIHNIHHDYLAFQFNVRFAHPFISWLFYGGERCVTNTLVWLPSLKLSSLLSQANTWVLRVLAECTTGGAKPTTTWPCHSVMPKLDHLFCGLQVLGQGVVNNGAWIDVITIVTLTDDGARYGDHHYQHMWLMTVLGSVWREVTLCSAPASGQSGHAGSQGRPM